MLSDKLKKYNNKTYKIQLIQCIKGNFIVVEAFLKKLLGQEDGSTGKNFATKPDDQSLNPRTHMVEGKKQIPRSLDFHAQAHTHK